MESYNHIFGGDKSNTVVNTPLLDGRQTILKYNEIILCGKEEYSLMTSEISLMIRVNNISLKNEPWIIPDVYLMKPNENGNYLN